MIVIKCVVEILRDIYIYSTASWNLNYYYLYVEPFKRNNYRTNRKANLKICLWLSLRQCKYLLTLIPPTVPDIRIVQDVQILAERPPRQPQERKLVEERSTEKIMVRTPTTPPLPTVECDDLPSVELEETEIMKLEKIKSLPIPDIENAVIAVRNVLDALPSLFISDSSSASLSSLSPSLSSFSPLPNPLGIANHHSLIAASFSSFAVALGCSESALSKCNIALKELSIISSTANIPLTSRLATKFTLPKDINGDLSDTRTQGATILANIKASADSVGETQGSLEEIPCRPREVEEPGSRMFNRSGSSGTTKSPPPAAIGLWPAIKAHFMRFLRALKEFILSSSSGLIESIMSPSSGLRAPIPMRAIPVPMYETIPQGV
jgi:hypothetical protein